MIILCLVRQKISQRVNSQTGNVFFIKTVRLKIKFNNNKYII